jgi:signal transduction histidine kinase
MGDGQVTVAMGLDLDVFAPEIRRSLPALVAALPVALLLIGVFGWLVSDRALRPVRRLTEATRRVTAKGLDQRLSPEGEEAEFLPLIAVFNEMLDRLRQSFDQAVRFSADAAHELKTPLTILQGELEEALQAAPPGSEEQRRYGELLEEVQRLKAIVRNLLLLSLADAGQLRPNLTLHNLSEALEEVVEDAQVMAPELAVSQDLAPDVWVNCDPDLITQVIRNLAANAVKYNRAGGAIHFGLSAEEGQARLVVSNTGLGIRPEDRERVFDRFYRGDRSRGRKVDGVGLGLSLAREIVRAHGGELALEPGAVPGAAEKGVTTFAMALPLAARDGSSPPPA